MSAEDGLARAGPSTGADDGPKSKKRKQQDDLAASQAKQRACHSCRRAKLRCVQENGEGEPCKRCMIRGEECRFKIPLHDEKWQETTGERIDSLHASMTYLVRSVEAIARHLDLPFDPPPLAPSSSNGVQQHEQHLQQQQQQQQRRPEHDYLTQNGAQELLAQAYARFSPPFPASSLNQQSPSSTAQSHLAPPPLPSNTSGFFGLLDDLDWSAEGAARKGSGGAGKARASENLDLVGSQDPRVDVVKSGIVPQPDAEILVDFFHAHLGQHLFGFPFRLGSWPYLPAGGRATITPLILGAICLVGSERIPRYHELIPHLAASDLREAILNAEPGHAFAPVQQAQQQGYGGPDQAEPDLDLELGIGPEEISSLLIYATLSASPRSDTIARTAFEMTRGYLKTFMLPQPPPVTYGEVLGLLPARRDLTFENWLRLWLFAYIVDVQQSLHHERPAPIFDPTYFSDTLLIQQCSLAAEQSDRELVAHARLCALLQRVQHIRLSTGWRHSTADEIVAAHERWNADLDQWWAGQELESPAHSTVLSLTLFRLYARAYLNLAASKEQRLGDSQIKWRFRATSVRASFDMLRFVHDEPAVSCLNILLPFYIKMVTLAAIILLDSQQFSSFIMLPCSHAQGIEMISRVALNLERSPVPHSHTAHIAAGTLRKALERAERELGAAAAAEAAGGGGGGRGRSVSHG
ncbi:hypothetical protein RQP46_002278 [Phenoliferia psychrophenolica]